MKKTSEKAKDMLVYKANALIQKSRYDLSLQEQKFILYTISLIKPDDPPEKDFIIPLPEACRVLDIVEKGANYARLKNAMANIAKSGVWVYDKQTNADYRLTWIDRVSVHYSDNSVRFQIDPRMRPYLFQLRKNFTAYELREVLRMKSKYSIRLYELLKSYELYGSYEVTLDELRKQLDAENYSNYNDFRFRVLEKAIDEIHAYTHLIVSFTPERMNRSVHKLKFTIKNESREYEQNRLTEKEEQGYD